MVSIKNENWFIIEWKLVYGYETPHKELINLSRDLWIDTRYQKIDNILVDYPGEYDIQWIAIKCFVGKWDKLNYIIDINDSKVWIFQSPEVFESEETIKANTWLYTDDRIAEKIDQLELEWEKIKLENRIIE
jgi:hypothetical protein